MAKIKYRKNGELVELLDTEKIYKSIEDLSQGIVLRDRTQDVASGQMNTSIPFEAIDGYRIVGFINVRSNGWIGSPYCAEWGEAYAKIFWTVAPDVNASVSATAIYFKSGFFE